VASFFISRIDSAVDKELKAVGNNDLLGKVAVANAHRAYALFLEKFTDASWIALEESGALVQRPLWASTGVKDPAYSDTLYVDTLVAPHTVNTMPQSTLDAFLDHGVVKNDAITSQLENASQILAALSALGISLDAITDALEADGVKKFEDAWISLLADVKKVMA
jgi:transaldolase